MRNPWEEIALSDYENHMKLDSVMQLQVLNAMMREQFDRYPVKSVMILSRIHHISTFLTIWTACIVGYGKRS